MTAAATLMTPAWMVMTQVRMAPLSMTAPVAMASVLVVATATVPMVAMARKIRGLAENNQRLLDNTQFCLI